MQWRDKIVDRVPIENFIKFCGLLKQPDGLNAGQPIVMADFQKDIAQIFGRDANGDRVVDRVLITVPRKNAKTALAAFMVLYLLSIETIPHAQHYSIANDREQAAIIFNYARNVVRMTPELNGIISITDSRKLLTSVKNGSTFTALSSEGKSKHGKSSRFCLVDECAQVDEELISIMETSMGAYGKEALFVIIGTQSPSDVNVMSRWVDYAKSVEDGTIVDDSFAGFVWAAPEEADIMDEKVWMECNPAMVAGFRSYEEFKKLAARAQEMGGRKLAEFRNLYLNQRVDSSSPFITKDIWMNNAGKPDQDAFQLYPVYGGLDLSARSDLTSLALVCEDENHVIHVRSYSWTPQELVSIHEKTDKAPYKKWIQDGFIETVPGRSIGYDWIAYRLAEIVEDIPQLESIAYDRWRIKELKRELDEVDAALPLSEFGQGYKSMSPAIEALEHTLAEKQMRHGGNPLLTWSVSNAVAVKDPTGNIKLDKTKSFSERIDPVIALVMAMGALRVDQETMGMMGSDEAIMFI